MPYTAAQLDQLTESYETWTDRRDTLTTALLTRTYATERAREFAFHGLSRRLDMLQHCLDRTFEQVPPEAERPERAALMDATAFIQTFVVNIYGAIDNLAHIWCLDAAVRDQRGRPLAVGRIGLMPKNDIVCASLSSQFQNYLASHADWFAYLEGYRHALAHRIPLYIPPCRLDPAAQAEFSDLDTQWTEAVADRDWTRADALQDARDRLGEFEPYIMHSFGEQARPMYFHAQMICDLATVVEIGEYMLRELDALVRPDAQEGKA